MNGFAVYTPAILLLAQILAVPYKMLCKHAT